MRLLEEVSRRQYNAVTEFVDWNITRGLGARIAFLEAGRAISYAELQTRTVQFAAALQQFGLQQEERLVLLLNDSIEYPVAFWGAIRAGLVVVPLSTLLLADHYAHMLADSRAAAIIVAAPLVAPLKEVLASARAVRRIIVVGAASRSTLELSTKAQVHRFEHLLAGPAPPPFARTTFADEVALWVYTSGSTGTSKAAKHVHSSLSATAKLFGQNVLGLNTDDVVFSAAKLFFAYGLGNAMSFPMSVGASAVLLAGRPTPEAVFEVMRRHNPTVFYAVPSLYASMLAHPGLRQGAGSNRLRLCISAGEALPAAIGKAWRNIVGVDILDGMGSTEMLQTFLSNRPSDVRYGTTGKPVPGYEAKIVDEDGRELPDGEMGELMVRGPSAAEGYWNQRVMSWRTFLGEWTRTGDKFIRDQDGYYHFCGRTDDMLKVSGMWVSPVEVEAALLSHPAVLEAAVIGRQDGDGLTKPKAFVVLQNGYAPDPDLLEGLRLHVKQRAGPWKYPRWIEVCAALPRTATGKIQRFKLREQESLGSAP